MCLQAKVAYLSHSHEAWICNLISLTYMCIYIYIYEKKDAESQSKYTFLIHVKQLHVSAIYSHHKKKL
jgi:hypothetical protein